MQSGTRSNLADIDVMRGVAALVVAAFHTREITWIGVRELWHQCGLTLSPNAILGYLSFPLVWGSIGVPIFFVISGYCIHRSQAFTRASEGTYRLQTVTFYLRRFFRIYPVLIAALLLTLVCDHVSRQSFPNSYKLGDNGPVAFLVNLFSLQGLAGPAYGSNLPLWTLSIEVQFYALYPILILTMSRLGILRTLYVLGAANVASYFIFEANGLLIFSSYYVSWYLGALVAEIEAANPPWASLLSKRRRAIVCICGYAILGLGCAIFFVSTYLAFQVWAASFAILMLVMLRRKAQRRGYLRRALQVLGGFSFSLYIIHMPIVVLIHSTAFNSVHQISIAPFFATLAAAIGSAFIFSLIVERPALTLSQMLKSGRRLTKPTASS